MKGGSQSPKKQESGSKKNTPSSSPKKNKGQQKDDQELQRLNHQANNQIASDQNLFSQEGNNPDIRKKIEEIQLSNHQLDYSSKLPFRKKDLEEIVKDRNENEEEINDAQEQQLRQYMVKPKTKKLTPKVNGNGVAIMPINQINEDESRQEQSNKNSSTSPVKGGGNKSNKNNGIHIEDQQQQQRNSQNFNQEVYENEEGIQNKSTFDSRQQGKGGDFSERAEREMNRRVTKKRKTTKRDSNLGLSAEEKALLEKMKLNTIRRDSSKSPQNTLIGKQIYDEQLGQGLNSNRRVSSQLNPNQSGIQSLRKKSIFNSFQASNSSNATPQRSTDEKERRLSGMRDATPNRKSVILDEKFLMGGKSEAIRKKSINTGISKYGLNDFRQRLNSIRRGSSQSESGLSNMGQGINQYSDFEKEILQEQEAGNSPQGIKSGNYQKIRDLLQQQLDQDGGYFNQENEEEEENEVNINDQMNMLQEEMINQIDPEILEDYERLTQDNEKRAENIYLRTYRAEKKTAFDLIGELFYKPTFYFKIFRFFFKLQWQFFLFQPINQKKLQFLMFNIFMIQFMRL